MVRTQQRFLGRAVESPGRADVRCNRIDRLFQFDILVPTRTWQSSERPIGLLIAAWMAGAVAMAGKRVSELDEFDHQITAAAYRRSFAHYTRSRLMISLVIYLVISLVFGIRFILG